MKLKVEFAGRTRSIELARDGRRLTGTVDGHAVEADTVEVGPGIYSFVMGGATIEAQVESTAAGLTITVAGRRMAARVLDPRQWQGRGGGGV